MNKINKIMNRNSLKRSTLLIGLGFLYLLLKEYNLMPFKSSGTVEGFLFGLAGGGLALLIYEVFFNKNKEADYE